MLFYVIKIYFRVVIFIFDSRGFTMDLSKAFNIDVGYRDKQTRLEWNLRLFAEVVLIDKIHSSLKPLLYQLKDNAFILKDYSTYRKGAFSSLPNDAFVLLGEVVSLDKKNKQILLSDKNIVAYNYLIVASGARPNLVGSIQDEEFFAGLQALIDALRVKKKIPMAFASHELSGTCDNSKQTHYSQNNWNHPLFPSKNIDKVAHPRMSSRKETVDIFNLAAINKRLYEVQV
jgi:Pyridine nucleotide-disulphide oxidoreductase